PSTRNSTVGWPRGSTCRVRGDRWRLGGTVRDAWRRVGAVDEGVRTCRGRDGKAAPAPVSVDLDSRAQAALIGEAPVTGQLLQAGQCLDLQLTDAFPRQGEPVGHLGQGVLAAVLEAVAGLDDSGGALVEVPQHHV